MNETIKMISAIESQMNKHWSTVLDSLKDLNENITTNLDSLLTGINPKGLRETSKSLREIMDTMNKSVQSMNLEKVLSELKGLTGGGMVMVPAQMSGGQQQVEALSAGMNLKPPGGAATTASTGEETVEWVDPHEAAKKKKAEDDEDQHLLKPSDFFGM
jgi:reverse gyrase